MIDVATIKIRAGDGGDGRVSFRHERFVPKGGPDGGDGGNGGSVYLVSDNNMATLMDFRSRPNYKAESGVPGGHKKMTGSGGSDLFIKVPVGTLVDEVAEEGGNEGKNWNAGKSGEKLVGDLKENDQKLLLAKGGVGGKGNYHFKSSVNRTPYEYTPGTKGEAKTLKFEIKMVADVGFVGMPNAGKSTLINQLTNAHAKVANYPFTTLNPNLGTCKLKNGREIVIADIPGLIEGASEGKGLGFEFLRHVERTRLLVHLIDPYNEEIFAWMSSKRTSSGTDAKLNKNTEYEEVCQYVFELYKKVRTELEKRGGNLPEKSEIVVINKLDLTEVKEAFPHILKFFKKEKIEVLGISAYTGEGTEKLKDKIMEKLETIPTMPVFEVEPIVKTYTIENLPNKRMVRRIVPKKLLLHKKKW